MYANFFDSNKGEFIDLPPEVLEQLSPSAVLLAHTGPQSEIRGFLPLNDHYLLVASRPILTSSYQGPIRGAVIFGRLLDEGIEASLAEQTQTALRLIPLKQASTDAELTNVLARLKAEWNQRRTGADSPAPSYISISQNTVQGYLLLEDIYRQPALLLVVQRTRPIYQAALNGILLSALILLLTAAFLGLFMARTLDQLILKPLAQLRRAIHQIALQGDLSLRLPLTETDEINSLAADFNEMLENLAQSKAALQHARAELLEQAGQLVEINQTLQAEIEERKAIEHSLQLQSTQQAQLFEIAHHLSSSLNVQEVLQRIANGAREILKADGCSIYLLQPDGRTLKPVMVIEDEY